MTMRVIERDDRYVLNYCAKHLARERGAISERWRFPIVDRTPAVAATTSGGTDAPAPAAGGLPAAINAPPMSRSWVEDVVTFVWDARRASSSTVAVTGSMNAGAAPTPLRSVLFDGLASGYLAVSMAISRGTVHRYLFVVDGALQPDPINPQRERGDNGTVWSRFFTSGCMRPLVLERWEFALLERLTDHIMPFRTQAGERFLADFYYRLDRKLRDGEIPLAYKIDQSIGIANFIDCLLAREEAHRLIDYHICLGQIARILAGRHPYKPLAEVPREAFIQLYEELGANDVPQWNYGAYREPRFFLKLLRRHAVTGAFAHPDYGGNTGGAAWAFLSERYFNNTGTLFDFGSALERGLGQSTTYLG